MRRKISWTDRGKTVYTPPPSGSGCIIKEFRVILHMYQQRKECPCMQYSFPLFVLSWTVLEPMHALQKLHANNNCLTIAGLILRRLFYVFFPLQPNVNTLEPSAQTPWTIIWTNLNLYVLLMLHSKSVFTTVGSKIFQAFPN